MAQATSSESQTEHITRPKPNAAALKRQREQEYAQITRRVSKAKQLNERDFNILRRVATGHVLSLDQAREVFWKKDNGELAALTTAQNRLNQLVGAGYLKKDYTNVRRPGEQVYCLTHAGAQLLTPQERRHAAIGMPNYKEMKQQLDGQDARIKLEQSLADNGERLLHWKSERQVRSEALAERSQREFEQAREEAAKTHHYQNLKQYHQKTRADEGFEALNVGDAQAVIERPDGSLYTVDIEIDGKYYGKMLSQKICGMKELAEKSGTPLIWATSGTARTARIMREVEAADATDNITVMNIG